MSARPDRARVVRAGAVALAAFLLGVLPDFAAPPLTQLAGREVGRSAVVDMPGAPLARELAYQRCRSLGLEPAHATSVIGAVSARAAMGLVDRDLAARLPADAAEEAGRVARILAGLLAAGPRMGGAEDLVWAFGMEDVFDLGVPDEERLRMSASGRSNPGAGLVDAADVGGAGGAAPSIGGTCLTCPNVDGGPFTPDFAWQSIDANLFRFPDCAWYSFDVAAGITYQFKTCGPEGATDFDSAVDLYDPSGGAPCGFLDSNDDCSGIGPGSLLTWSASLTGVVHLRVRQKATDLGGDFRLAYRKICPASSDCSDPDATLNAPRTSCQYVTGTLDACSASRYYAIALVHDQRYTFTLCSATCASAFADFDSALELSLGGGIVASDTGSCGDDAEIVFDVVLDGTYCVRVSSEGGAGEDFSLGYRVACQPPSDLEILPVLSGTNAPDCTKDQRFSITMGGTADFGVSWSILPDPGNSATPDRGMFTTTGNAGTFDSLLQGDGAYVVTVTVTNECGSVTESIVFTLEDRAGPSLVAIAEAAPCRPFTIMRIDAPPRRAPRSPGVAPPAALPDPGRALADVEPRRMPSTAPDLAVIREALHSSPDPRAVEESLARKLGVAAKSIRVVDSRDPGFFRPPNAEALGCSTPCTGGRLSQLTNDYYDVFLNCADGAFTARTGRLHPVTLANFPPSPENVIFGGQSGFPGTSDVTFHVFETGDNFLDPSGGRTCLFTPTSSPFEPAAAGIESEWTRALANGTSLTLREEIVAFGDTPANSGIRLTLGAANTGGPAVTMGVRWQIDYQNADDDGPHYAQVHCSPFEIFNSRSTEHEFSAAEIADQDFYRIQNNTGSPVFGNFNGTAALGGFDGTGKPDRLVYGYWGRMTGSPWNYLTMEGDTAPDADSAVLYYFGYAAPDGIVIAAGESFTRSVILFTAGDATDCGTFRAGSCEPATVRICPGECARVGAIGTDNCGPATVSLVGTSPGAPTCGPYPCTMRFPDAGQFVYTWEAVDEAGHVQRCTSTVIVEDTGSCNRAPACDAGGPYASPCREAVVDGAGVDDPDGDAITYAWTSDRGDVTIDPPGGILPGSSGSRGVPASIVTLDPGTPACGVVANLTLTIDDGRGGGSSCTTSVTFSDETPPGVLGLGGAVACLWPPNHWYVPFGLDELGVAAVDDCNEPVSLRIVGCVSDQPDDARESDPTSPWNGDGHTTDDCVVSADGATVHVRSERCGRGPAAQDGRHYGIIVVATDACGNASAPGPAATIHVPHDLSPAERGCRNPTEEGFREIP